MNSTPHNALTRTQQLLALSALAALMAWPVTSFAQTGTTTAAPNAAVTVATVATDSAPATDAGMTNGEVKKINLDTGKVTIKHGPIAHMDMPGMTMVFTAKDKNLLANLKPGDKIKFMVVDENRKMMVTDIQAQ